MEPGYAPSRSPGGTYLWLPGRDPIWLLAGGRPEDYQPVRVRSTVVLTLPPCPPQPSIQAAIIRLTEILSLELADQNIQVNALGPGSIHTRMWEEITDGAQAVGDNELYEFGLQVTGGGGAPIERAAELAVWLASDAADGLSGRLIHAVADDFPSLTPLIPQIMASDRYTLRRDEP